MSVDFYGCDCCGESRYEEYVGRCNNCGASICTSCVINDDVQSKYAYEYGYRFDSKNEELMKKYQEEGFDLYDEEGNPYYEDGEIIDDSDIDSKHCPFCNGNKYDPEKVLKFVIEKYNLDLNTEIKDYKSQE